VLPRVGEVSLDDASNVIRAGLAVFLASVQVRGYYGSRALPD